MVCTENDAKKKWCPMSRMNGDAGCNRHTNGDIYTEAKCIADRCMFWTPTDDVGGNYGFCGLGYPHRSGVD
jgi:hypothetical protein